MNYTASGWFDFDVLLEFDPFLIVADLAAGCGVCAGNKELFGIDLEVHLEGPEPWFASCHARVQVLPRQRQVRLHGRRRTRCPTRRSPPTCSS